MNAKLNLMTEIKSCQLIVKVQEEIIERKKMKSSFLLLSDIKIFLLLFVKLIKYLYSVIVLITMYSTESIIAVFFDKDS